MYLSALPDRTYSTSPSSRGDPSISEATTPAPYSREATTSGLRRRRTGGPKVRTGCITCKLRHVKCDERKPWCYKCEKTGFECAGYRKTKDVELDEKARAASRALAPRPQDRQLSPRINPAPVQIGGGDAVYFDLFRHRLAPGLAGYCYGEFWCEIVLRETMLDECIRHSVLAVGALTQALFMGPVPEDMAQGLPVSAALRPFSQNVLNEDHKAALCHHTKAISLFRERILRCGNRTSPRTVFIATLLFMAFELIQGDLKAFDNLLASGVNLLKDSLRLAQDHRQASPSPSPSPSSTSFLSVPDDGRGRTRASSTTPVSSAQSRPSSPAPLASTGENDLRIFEHMIPRLSIFTSWNPFLVGQCFNTWVPSYGSAAGCVGLVPSRCEARRNPRHALARFNDFATRAMAFANRVYRMRFGVDADEGHISQETIECEVETFLALLERWRGLLDALAEHLDGDGQGAGGDGELRRGVDLVRLHHRVLATWLRGVPDPTGLVYDSYVAEYVAIMDEAEALVARYAPAGGSMTFDAGVVPTLGFMCHHCREPRVRRRALALLRSEGWRESAWDGAAEWAGLDALMRLEEAGAVAVPRGDGCSGGGEELFVPPTKRYLWTAASWDFDKSLLLAEYTRLVPDAMGRVVKVQLPVECSQVRAGIWMLYM